MPITSGSKRCPKCGQTKSRIDFYLGKSPSSYCRECTKEAARAYRARDLKRHAARARQYNKRFPDRKADADQKTKRGVPRGTYARLLAEQNGQCAICGTTKDKRYRRLALDHCHETGKMRGLLCGSCNTGIGQLHHDPERMVKAIAYLNLHHPGGVPVRKEPPVSPPADLDQEQLALPLSHAEPAKIQTPNDEPCGHKRLDRAP